ncbi:MAG: thiamine pyrophosphate-binding protein [Alphaproteobacteria bacterium]|nr:thiamine pyrophosphate-binding protein [Alphaproteobacteria bacterium]
MSAPGAPTVAALLVDRLAERGVKRMFGVPGGGSSLDLIEAGAARGIDFMLARNETAAAIMAATTAELGGAPGVVLTGLGPGAANAVNGIAHAFLDRAPLVIVTDCFDPARDSHVTHQAIDHARLFAAVSKGSARLDAANAAEAIARLLEIATTPPRGPVHIDLSSTVAASPAAMPNRDRGRAGERAGEGDDRLYEIDAARALIHKALRPVIVAGLLAREPDAPEALAALARKLDCPVYVTYKAKGVLADDHALSVGLFTGGAAEAEGVGAADLVILFGLDPVELIPQRWRYAAPILELSPQGGLAHYRAPTARMIGPLDQAVAMLRDVPCAPRWSRGEITRLRAEMRDRLASPQGGPIDPQALVEAVHAHAPAGARLAIDAGAHMIPATTFWPARTVNGALISNGLATMGFALPAAIAAALHEPDGPVVAMTGDGGLAMCLGELETARRLGVNIVVIVFNDAALSLIDIKQQARRMTMRGVRTPAIDFAATARGLGLLGLRVEREDMLADALLKAFAAQGPVVVDVTVDPSGYAAQLQALRG